ncbi:hypothetical protein Z042_02470 [Chania multitudinisentens RB-25]|uniref:Uncharacterized protein n=2 Tax=Chania TaxID=1745211 RepID=W0LKT5_9GAMM|nr:hypothetical protein Z042_02470 [Chania multitudinisentens RB-25]
MAADNEKPRHAVCIEKSFYIGRFEVTQEQWQEVRARWKLACFSHQLTFGVSPFIFPGLQRDKYRFSLGFFSEPVTLCFQAFTRHGFQQATSCMALTG